MGNLLSIHTVIILKHELRRGEFFTPLGIASKLLGKYNGMSYNGFPIYLKDLSDSNHAHFRISYGEKGEPRELIEFANSNEKLISKIFARTYYESGDFDYFISTPFESNDYDNIKKPCRYGFDEIKFKLTKGEKINETITKSELDYTRIKLKGEMSSISNLIEQEYTEITSNPIEHYRSIHGYSNNNFKTQRLELLNEILDKSEEVIFLYDGKTIHKKIRTNEFVKQNPILSNEPRMIINFKHANESNKGYFDFYSSGWSNCINNEYLEYLKKENIKPTHNTW